jgi:predicted DNA-binding WGR domain protein
MTVQRDLFGGASLIREWGRVGSPGKVRIEHHPDEGHALNALWSCHGLVPVSFEQCLL